MPCLQLFIFKLDYNLCVLYFLLAFQTLPGCKPRTHACGKANASVRKVLVECLYFGHLYGCSYALFSVWISFVFSKDFFSCVQLLWQFFTEAERLILHSIGVRILIIFLVAFLTWYIWYICIQLYLCKISYIRTMSHQQRTCVPHLITFLQCC